MNSQKAFINLCFKSSHDEGNSFLHLCNHIPPISIFIRVELSDTADEPLLRLGGKWLNFAISDLIAQWQFDGFARFLLHLVAFIVDDERSEFCHDRATHLTATCEASCATPFSLLHLISFLFLFWFVWFLLYLVCAFSFYDSTPSSVLCAWYWLSISSISSILSSYCHLLV